MQTVPQGSTLSTSTGEEQLITKGRKLTESSGKKQMLTIIFSTFFCRGSRGSELLFPFPPLLWRRFRPGFELFGSGPLALGDRGRRGCQTQQGFHLNPPRCQKRNVSPSKAANPPAPPRPDPPTYLREFMGLQRGFRLQSLTYSLLLTVSRNLTYTRWYMALASPKYPRYCRNRGNQTLIRGFLFPTGSCEDTSTSAGLRCWWPRRPSFHLLTRARISAAEPSELSRWPEVRCPLSSSPGCTSEQIWVRLTDANICRVAARSWTYLQDVDVLVPHHKLISLPVHPLSPAVRQLFIRQSLDGHRLQPHSELGGQIVFGLVFGCKRGSSRDDAAGLWRTRHLWQTGLGDGAQRFWFHQRNGQLVI